jgi:hypothetical protein
VLAVADASGKEKKGGERDSEKDASGFDGGRYHSSDDGGSFCYASSSFLRFEFSSSGSRYGRKPVTTANLYCSESKESCYRCYASAFPMRNVQPSWQPVLC